MRTALLSFVFFSLISTSAFGQEKIQWSFDFVPYPASLQISAKIENGWHLYALDLDPSIGPVPTQIVLEKNKAVQVLNAFEANTKAKQSYDPNFGAEVSYFENSFEARNRIKVKKPTTVKGELTYMLCDDKRCLPPQTVPFEIKVTPYKLQKPN
ncbi:MAG: protein-disulfide reductase DsbD domain-containing protein [Flavobacteriia bacterium]